VIRSSYEMTDTHTRVRYEEWPANQILRYLYTRMMHKTNRPIGPLLTSRLSLTMIVDCGACAETLCRSPWLYSATIASAPLWVGVFEESEPGSAGRTRPTKQEETEKKAFGCLSLQPKFEGQYTRRIAYNLPLLH